MSAPAGGGRDDPAAMRRVGRPRLFRIRYGIIKGASRWMRRAALKALAGGLPAFGGVVGKAAGGAVVAFLLRWCSSE